MTPVHTAPASIPASGSSDARSTCRLTTASPLGRIVVEGDGTAVTRLEIERAGTLSTDGEPDTPDDLTRRAVEQLAEYFSGSRQAFDVPVRLDGTLFQRAIWQSLSAIPFGATLSYGELGRQTGRATAGRAVGGAVGANPVPLIVPCHRVLASDQRITGYSAGDGVPTKIWLLDHEGISHR
ncbi:MAG: methylated-DNA--[protein]-cysteine S-methyltransferase [Microcella sp.]|uniref:methylated-DNA--[protein]-cysteine S-methyltransferase n=1 Tax=Microcella sp. TaxID=1913979 RepID=UPI0033146F0C